MLLVLEPAASVLGAIHVLVDALAMSLVVLPIADVDVTVRVDESTAPIRSIILPVAFVNAAIKPNMHTASAALSFIDVPLACVLGAIFHLMTFDILKTPVSDVLI